MDEMVTWLKEGPTVTLEFLPARVKAEFDKDVSLNVISNDLDPRLITLEKLHLSPFGMNNPDTLSRCLKWADWKIAFVELMVRTSSCFAPGQWAGLPKAYDRTCKFATAVAEICI